MDFRFLLTETWEKFISNIVNLVIFFLLGSILCLTIVLIPTVLGGFTRGYLGYVREGNKPEFSELWDFSNYVQLVLLFFVGGALVSIGYMFLIIPGIVLTVWWMYACYFVVDKQMGFWQAMSTSKEAVGKNGFINHFVILLVLFVLNALGSAAAGFGSIFTAPFGFLLLTVVFIEHVENIDETKVK